MLWPSLFVPALLASALVHLDTPLGHRVVCDVGGKVVSDVLTGELTVGECTVVRPYWVRLGDARLTAPDGLPVARVAGVEARLDLVASFFERAIVIAEARVTGPWASLRPGPADTPFALVTSVLPVDQGDEEEDEDPDGGGGGPTVVIERAIIEDGSADELPTGLSARDLSVAGAVRVEGGNVEVTVSDLGVEAFRDGERIGTVRAEGVRIAIAPGERSAMSVVVEERGPEGDAVLGRVEASVAFDWSDEGGPVDVEMTADARATPRLLARATGVGELGTILRAPVRLDARARGPVFEELALEGSLETAGGRMELTADLTPERLEATADLPDLRVGDVVTLAAGRLAGSLGASIPLSGAGDVSLAVDLKGRQLRLPGELRIDQVAVRGDIDGTLPTPTVDLRVRAARWPFDRGGSLVLEGAQLRIRGGPRGSDEGAPRGAYTVAGTTNLSGIREVAARVDLRVGVVAAVPAPPEDAGPEIQGPSPADPPPPDPLPTRITGSGSLGIDGIWPGPLRVVLQDVAFDRPEESLSFGSLALTAEGLAIQADGRLGLGEGTPIQAEATVGILDLDRLVAAIDDDLGLGLGGRVSGRLRMDGTPDRPELELRLATPGGLELEGLSLAQLEVEADWSSRRRRARARVDAALSDDGGTVAVDVGLRLAAGDPAQAVRRGRLTDVAVVEVTALDLARLAALWPDAPPALAGRVSVHLDARGRVQRPEATLRVSTDDVLVTPDVLPTDARLEVALAKDGTTEVRLGLARAADQGLGDQLAEPVLVQVDAKAVLPVPRLLAGRPIDPAGILLDEPWSFAVDIPERRLDQVGPPIETTLPIAVRARLDAKGGPDVPDGHLLRLDGGMRFDGDDAARRAFLGTDAPECASAAMATVAFLIESGRETEVTVLVEPEPVSEVVEDLDDPVSPEGGGERQEDADGPRVDDPILRVEATAQTPIPSWLREGLPATPPPVTLRAAMDQVDLSRLPVVCREAGGVLDLSIDGERLLTPGPELTLSVGAKDVTFHGDGDGGDPIALTIDGGLTPSRGRLDVEMSRGDRSILTIAGRLPVALAPDGLGGGLGEGPVVIDARFDETPVAALAGPIPLLARPAGTIDGEVHVEGRAVETADVSGSLELDAVALTVRDPFIRLRRVDGRIALADDRIVIEQLQTTDREGRLVVNGEVSLDRLAPGKVDLHVDLEKLPIRNEGVIYATLDGDVAVEGDLGADPRRLAVRLERLDAELPEESGNEVRSLDQHPQVIYRGQAGFDRSLSVSEALAVHQGRSIDGSPEGIDDNEPTPLVVTVKSVVPFWVRHPSFSFQLETDLRVTSEGSRTLIRGPVEVRRGFITLIGTTFDMQPGEIDFNGAIPVDPTLDLTAEHTVSTGHVVTVRITGHLGDPELDFSSTNPNVTTDAEIIASVLGVAGGSQGREEQAESETGALLAGLTAGFIGSLTRRELGQYLPILSVESAGTAESTKVRAGFQADSLIPDSLRSVVRGAYVEGIVAGSETDEAQRQNSGSGIRAGFLIELFFPRNFSTEAEYLQPDNWSLDILWEP